MGNSKSLFVMIGLGFVVLLAIGCNTQQATPAPTSAATVAPPTPVPSPTSSRNDDAVEQVAADGMEALGKMDWETYADLMHPEALQDFKDFLLAVLQAAGDKDPAVQKGLLSAFGGSVDIEAAATMEPKRFFARFMKGVTSQAPQLREIFTTMRAEIIGTVYEDDELAHVVFRAGMTVQEADVASVNVVSLKRSGTDWRMLLTAELQGLADQLGRSIRDD